MAGDDSGSGAASPEAAAPQRHASPQQPMVVLGLRRRRPSARLSAPHHTAGAALQSALETAKAQIARHEAAVANEAAAR